MDAYTIFKLNFAFEIWVDVVSEDGITSAYQFYKVGNGLLVPGVSQTYMFTKETLPYRGLLKNVVDAKGNAIFAEFGIDIGRYIISSEPVFDYQGILNGYRNVLRRDLPSIPVGGSH